jgi:hypothetical protein
LPPGHHIRSVGENRQVKSALHADTYGSDDASAGRASLLPETLVRACLRGTERRQCQIGSRHSLRSKAAGCASSQTLLW